MRFILISMLLLASCGNSVKNMEGKWIDENGENYFIQSAGDNKLVLIANGDKSYLLFGKKVLEQKTDNKNLFSTNKKDNYHDYYFEMTIQNENNIILKRVVKSIDTDLEVDNIVNNLTRLN